MQFYYQLMKKLDVMTYGPPMFDHINRLLTYQTIIFVN